MQENAKNKLPDIRQTLVLNAPLQKVWDAVATSEGIAAWFMPNDFQPKMGHEFSLHTPYGVSPCKVTAIEPPTRLSFKWGKDWHVSFQLEDLDGKTRFTLIHSGWAEDTVTETGEPHTVVRDRMDQGWGSSVLPRLRRWVEA